MSSSKAVFDSNDGSEAFLQKIDEFNPAVIHVYNTCKKKLQLHKEPGCTHRNTTNCDNLSMEIIFQAGSPISQDLPTSFNSLKDPDIQYTYNYKPDHKESTCLYFRTNSNVLQAKNTKHPIFQFFISLERLQGGQTKKKLKYSTELPTKTEQFLQFETRSWTLIKNIENYDSVVNADLVTDAGYRFRFILPEKQYVNYGS